MRMARFGTLVGAGALVATLSLTAMPAQACACGAFLAPEGAELEVEAEQAAIAWDGETERIVFSVNAVSDVDSGAILIPTPSKATVEEAGPGLFAELGHLTRPEIDRVSQWWPDFLNRIETQVATEHPVEVLDQIDVGPLDATVLAAKDADLLADWLEEHDVVMSDDLASALVPYVQEKWYFVMIDLDSQSGPIDGAVPPVSMTFASNQLIYPMRLSATASDPQLVRTYTFADHRMERSDATDDSRVLWAGPVSPTDFVDQTAVELAQAGGFLTLSEHYISRPSSISADFTFAAAGTDADYRGVTTVIDDKRILGVPAGPVLIFGGLVFIGVAGSVWSYRSRRAGLRLGR
ncbi:DUF2330 domain-containing protein [Pseudactinotalea sp. HY158]|uniref:DUF2330 domain-containing protein n=1 Tax=Pseudactinotalea sp. HY158 TaxID=2654547 RepID=UPI00129CC240|nr:DUF2330 domain-containing protein [Pseudactinotalea sp. HY158]QGH70760.1 DUF2330 domain-containing protein [Pseudactinotalea sp. HY158]